MIIITTIFYALLGWLVGIAINHAADISPTRQTVRQWPKCINCDTPRTYGSWSILVAYVTRQVNCPHCNEPRQTRVRAAVVEVATPLVFIFLLQRYGYTFQMALITLYTVILILVTVTDLEHRLILNIVMIPSILFALAMAFVNPHLAWPAAVVGGLVGFFLSYIAALVSRGGLGGGDVTLSTFLGLILGFPYILLSLGFGVILGGVVAFLLLVTRRVGMKTYIPYGPFLTITGWIMLIWGDEIWKYYFW